MGDGGQGPSRRNGGAAGKRHRGESLGMKPSGCGEDDAWLAVLRRGVKQNVKEGLHRVGKQEPLLGAGPI